MVRFAPPFLNLRLLHAITHPHPRSLIILNIPPALDLTLRLSLSRLLLPTTSLGAGQQVANTANPVAGAIRI
jgi:hypothetical protein